MRRSLYIKCVSILPYKQPFPHPAQLQPITSTPITRTYPPSNYGPPHHWRNWRSRSWHPQSSWIPGCSQRFIRRLDELSLATAARSQGLRTIPLHPLHAHAHTSNQQQPQGITFREANFNSPTTLDTAFRDVTKLLIISTDTLDVALRTQQQRYAIDAAKRQGVERIYYTSLAFGGFSDDSKVGLMAAHLATEAYLKAFVPPRTMREDVYLTESE